MYIVLLLSVVLLTSGNNITPIVTLSICYLCGCLMHLITIFQSEVIENNIHFEKYIANTGNLSVRSYLHNPN